MPAEFCTVGGNGRMPHRAAVRTTGRLYRAAAAWQPKALPPSTRSHLTTQFAVTIPVDRIKRTPYIGLIGLRRSKMNEPKIGERCRRRCVFPGPHIHLDQHAVSAIDSNASLLRPVATCGRSARQRLSVVWIAPKPSETEWSKHGAHNRVNTAAAGGA